MKFCKFSSDASLALIHFLWQMNNGEGVQISYFTILKAHPIHQLGNVPELILLKTKFFMPSFRFVINISCSMFRHNSRCCGYGEKERPVNFINFTF
jgi:hypothetical protein